MRLATGNLLYQAASLAVCFILVHSIYVGFVRPQAAAMLADPARDEQSLVLVIKDYEQESCMVLMLWALCLMGLAARRSLGERRLLGESLLDISEGTRVLPEDARRLARPLETMPPPQSDYLLVRALRAALGRYQTERSAPAAADAVRELCELENASQDSSLAMVRYIAWAIPSIGFIGTVRGIGAALGRAHEAMAGNIEAVTSNLGVAFNSTFVALLISIAVVFLMHQLSWLQEQVLLRTQQYCNDNLIRHLHSHDRAD